MSRAIVPLVSLLWLGACADQPVGPIVSGAAPSVQAGGGFMHRVTVGGPDICLLLDLRPGCDGNLSLVVLQRADGSLSGQGEDATGDHLTIDCLEVEGPRAWIGGTGDDGARWILRVVDAGQTANDSPDSASRRLFGGTDPTLCHRKPGGGLLATSTPVPEGQVTVQ